MLRSLQVLLLSAAVCAQSKHTQIRRETEPLAHEKVRQSLTDESPMMKRSLVTALSADSNLQQFLMIPAILLLFLMLYECSGAFRYFVRPQARKKEETPAGTGVPVLRSQATMWSLYGSLFALLRTWASSNGTKWTARGIIVGLVLWFAWREFANAALLSAYQAEVINQITDLPKSQDTSLAYHALLVSVRFHVLVWLPTAAIIDPWIMYFSTIRLRQFLTSKILNSYLSPHSKSYYHIKMNEGANGIDNPDQRICDDSDAIAKDCVDLYSAMLSAILGVTMWSTVILSIAGAVVVKIAFTFCTLKVMIAWFGYGRGLVGAHLDVIQSGAAMRYGLTRVRDSAEEIALSDGTDRERLQSQQHFSAIVASVFRQTCIRVRYGSAQDLCDAFPGVCLWLIIIPKIMSGELQFGDAHRVQMGYGQIEKVFGFLVENFRSLTELQANTERFEMLMRACEESDGHAEAIQYEEAPDGIALELQGFFVKAPNQAGLSAGVSLSCPAGKALMIVGPSGSGKTSVLRAISGLWTRGAGTVRLPGGLQPRLQFLPSRSYLPIASLQQLVCYPEVLSEKESLAEEGSVKKALVRAQLGYLLDRWGFLTEKDWRFLLSAGEQQRIAFARFFWNLRNCKDNSVLAVLDEATSACDVELEATLYTEMRQELQNGCSLRGFISVGHRPQLQAFHDTWLVLGDTVKVLDGQKTSVVASGTWNKPDGESLEWQQLEASSEAQESS